MVQLFGGKIRTLGVVFLVSGFLGSCVLDDTSQGKSSVLNTGTEQKDTNVAEAAAATTKSQNPQESTPESDAQKSSAPESNPEENAATARKLKTSAEELAQEALAQESLTPNTLTPNTLTGEGEPTRENPLPGAEFYPGTGVFVTGAQNADVGYFSNGTLSLNLVNVDISQAVKLILGDTLGESYIVDPAVQGNITVRTARPVSSGELISTLETMLELNGAALQHDGTLYRVVSNDKASSSITSPRNVNSGQGFGLYLLPLRYISAEEIKPTLVSMISGGGADIAIDKNRNLLLFSGTANEAVELTRLVETFDLDWMQGMSFAFVPLSITDPSIVIEELENIFELSDGPLKGVIRFVEIERLQAILVITKQPSYLPKIQRWIKRLDRGGEGQGRQLFVYAVKNTQAKDLAGILSEVFADSGGDGAGSGLSLSSSIVAPGLESVALDSGGGTADGASETAARSQTLSLPGTGSARGNGDNGQVKIIPDEKNNSLVILATPAEYKMIEGALTQLDIQPVQVLIEATIAEVTLKDELQFGLQWFFKNGNSTGTFSTLTSGAVSSAFPGFSYVFNTGDTKVVFNALDELSDVNVISSPQLMVLDNQSARLQVGDQVPIATQSAVSTDTTTAPIVNSIELKDTGVILEVTPRVSSSGLVVLDIKQEVSDVVSTTTSDIDSPTIQQRLIESSVAVSSGETIALGGIIRDRQEEGSSGLPLVSEIPVLGYLFKNTSEKFNRTELLVLITPRVVRNAQEAKDVTEELRLRLSRIEPLDDKIKAGKTLP
ncbi:type II secretion system secretin GspD [Kiloniella majae]|uniref:type II secretion system secretin GspD n=1 Tax=Kiloniella majae TaxID=1938558 RepID=UPI000F7829A2|nr:type II secretion system secretin GspD [Kiloniella majae]